MAPRKISTMLVDGEELVRQGFALALGGAPEVHLAAEAGTAQQALELLDQHELDLVITDVRLPGMDGIEALRLFLRRVPHVIVLTNSDSSEHLFRALKAGVSGYLLKDVGRIELIGAVTSVAAGNAVISPAMTRSLLDSFELVPLASTALYEQVLSALSAREIEVLRKIAQGGSNQEIANALHLTPATVKSHVSRVLAKLRLRDRVQAALLAHQIGLVRLREPEAFWGRPPGEEPTSWRPHVRNRPAHRRSFQAG
ncbi:response regulator transcription factor [Allokutzneria sp. A3M-2-11 16]|uniref:response regulator n=1 Tax=Allokutzneria sp. A3M-2-11 16 TaxID=2962043 RepID=UPI0020B8CB54|nr:response regulator transcription factor [Allokutzneria sp. A3M-2-11 16]MCP3805302.1 response regulator transcription factor [Allokutzneria sp. A3M-2-11 16]